MECRICGFKNSKNTRYCESCGMILEQQTPQRRIYWKIFLVVGLILLCLIGGFFIISFELEGEEIQKDVTCQHEWQNLGVTSSCTKCGAAIITPSENLSPQETVKQNISTENANESLISFLSAYEKEYGEFLDMYYDFGGYSFSPAILKDIDEDGEKELILHTFPVIWDSPEEEIPGYSPQVVAYTVYGFHDGEWTIEKETQWIGNISYIGYRGYAGVIQKNGKPVLYTYECKHPDGSVRAPGVEFAYTVTIYDNEYKITESFSVILNWEDEENGSIREIIEYKLNEKKISGNKFLDALSRYEGIHLDTDDSSVFIFDTEYVTLEQLISSLK